MYGEIECSGIHWAEWFEYKFNNSTILVKSDNKGLSLYIDGVLQDIKTKYPTIRSTKLIGQLKTGEKVETRIRYHSKLKCNLYVEGVLLEPVST